MATSHTDAGDERKKLNRDEIAMQAQLLRPSKLVVRLLAFFFGSFRALVQVYKRISPDMPDDLRETLMPHVLPDDPDAQVNLYSYDEGHAGRLSVPVVAQQGGSLSSEYVQAMTTSVAKEYVRTNLRFEPPVAAVREAALILFSPGLNTLHEEVSGNTSAPQRLLHYVRVALCLPMCQLHTGTSFDQGDIAVDMSDAWVLRLVMKLVTRFVKGGNAPYFADDDTLMFTAHGIDSIQTALSMFNIVDTPLKRAMRALLQATTKDDAVPIVFAVYSRASVEMLAALRKHVAESKDAGESDKQVFDRLRKYVTVFTIGTAARGYPDGPAYIHLSSWTDSLASSIGVNGKSPAGAGKDALFLNFDSPFHPDAFDNHNFGTVTSQYLSLVLCANKVTDLRELWMLFQQGTIVTPPNITATLPAVISMSRGLDWLWSSEDALKDVPTDTFPDKDAAFNLLSIEMGTEYAGRLRDAFAT